MSEESKTAITYRYERWRAISSGILETAVTTFLLLIAVRWFQAGAISKALVAGGGSLGLILAPLLVSTVQRFRWPAATAASRLAAVGAAAFLLPAAVPVLPLFVLGAVVGLTAAAAAIPLFTHIYQENYPASKRGQLFSRTVMIRIAVAALFSALAGHFLSDNLERFRLLLVVFAGAFAFASYCLARIPSQPLQEDGGTHPFRALRYARDDALFRRTLIAWMLMGFANLMMQPLRVEYLANPAYGLALTVGLIALLTGVLPNVVRLVMSPIWGWVFDRMNFFTLRIILNCGFALGILTFFTSDSLTGLVWGSLIFGVSMAGGDVAWSLWVTKFAPPGRVADYMSVHTFFTGVRGVTAPLLAFSVVKVVSLPQLGWSAVGLIMVATLLLIPELKWGRHPRHPTALAPEASLIDAEQPDRPLRR